MILELPVNPVSFGQVSTLILRELKKRKIDFNFLPIGNIDLSTQKIEDDFKVWLENKQNQFYENYSKDDVSVKLWHLNGGWHKASNKQYLITFYELDNPTPAELNIARQQEKVIVTSNFAKTIFNLHGLENIEYMPLAFDSYNFHRKDKKYYNDDRIVFNLLGKFEHRKHHKKVIQAWVKKYGNNPKYFLHCALYNPFLKPEHNQALFHDAVGGVRYFNVAFHNHLGSNEAYNDFLNAAHIVIGAGNEAWGLPEFQSVAIGKHAVMLNCNGYKDWISSENSVLINTSGKIPVYDNMFFHQGQKFNQGNIFTFKDDDLIFGCEEAVKRYHHNPVNIEGLKLQNDFSIKKTVDRLFEIIK